MNVMKLARIARIIKLTFLVRIARITNLTFVTKSIKPTSLIGYFNQVGNHYR